MSESLKSRGLRQAGARLWVRKCSSFAEENRADLEFWQRMTPDERVATVETMRREWWEQQGDGEQGLRRVVRVLAAP